jgi:hypothetical protein
LFHKSEFVFHSCAPDGGVDVGVGVGLIVGVGLAVIVGV